MRGRVTHQTCNLEVPGSSLVGEIQLKDSGLTETKQPGTTQSKATAHRPTGLQACAGLRSTAEQSVRPAQPRTEHMRDLSLKMKT